MRKLKGKALELDFAQQDFLLKLLAYGAVLEEWTLTKAQFRGAISPICGIRAELLIADMLLKTEFGSHPLSNSNNLGLLEYDKSFPGKPVTYKGKQYRAYKSWTDFITDYTDYLVWSDKFNSCLLTLDLTKQIQIFCLAVTTQPMAYNGSIKDTISKYKLSELLDEF